MREIMGRAFLLFAGYVVESTSVDLTTRSRHQPQGFIPRLFRHHPATKPTKHQELSTNHTLKQPPSAQPAHKNCASSTESAGGFDRASFFDYVRRPRSFSLGNLTATIPPIQIRSILRSGFSPGFFEVRMKTSQFAASTHGSNNLPMVFLCGMTYSRLEDGQVIGFIIFRTG